MDIGEKADTSEVTKFVENGNGELMDKKLPENEAAKKIKDGLKRDEDREVKEAVNKDTDGEESDTENEELDQEMAEFLTEVPTEGEEGSELSGTESAEKAPWKVKQIKVPSNELMYCEKVLRINRKQLFKLQGRRNMKVLLIERLGNDNVKIKPPMKRREKQIYIFFATEDDMNLGKQVLEEQLTRRVKIVSGLGLNYKPCINKYEVIPPAPLSVKRKLEEEVNNEPPPKKQKYTENQDFYFNEESYYEQVKLKNADARKIVEEFGTNLIRDVPKLKSFIIGRTQKCSGLMCTLNELVECSSAQRLLARCRFAIGIDEDTGEVAVGFSTTEGKVKKNCKARQYFLPDILQEADVFEKLVKYSEREPGQGSTGFWCELIARCNTKGIVMLNVVVQAPKEKAQEELKYLKGIITEFYESGAGKNSDVTSVYSKVRYINDQQECSPSSSIALSWGSEYLEEKFIDMQLLLDPKTFFFFNVHTAEILCNTVTSLLNPINRLTVVEIGCFSGCLGMHLERSNCKVLCVGTKPAAAEAVLKEQTSTCHYYPGEVHEVLKTLKMQNRRGCAVITTTPQPLASKVSVELRKQQEIKRIVVVTEATGFIASRAFTLLISPSDNEELGNPFYPKEIIPVDTMPNTKHFTLVILMERLSTDSRPKRKFLKRIPFQIRTPFRSRKHVPPKRMGPYQNGGRVRVKKTLPSGDLKPALNQSSVKNQFKTPLRIQSERKAEQHERQFLEVKEKIKERLQSLTEEVHKQKLLIKARERELSSKSIIQEVSSDTVTEDAVPILDNEAAVKLKHVITEAIRGAGILNSKEQAMMQSGQDKMIPGAQYIRSAPEHQNPVGGTRKANKSGITNQREDRNLPYKDSVTHSKIRTEREPVGDRRGFDNVTHSARMASGRTDRKVHPRSLHNRDSSLDGRISKDRSFPFKDNFSNTKGIKEREPVGETRGFDSASYTARMTSSRTDRDVNARSLDIREMSFDNRISNDRNFPFKNSFSHNEREPVGDRTGFNTHTARMTPSRADKDVHPRSLDIREMSLDSRISKDRNLPFKNSFSHNEREPVGDRTGFNTHTARMTSSRAERDVHPRSLDNREMSFDNRISNYRNLPFKDHTSYNKRINERESMDDTRGFDNASYTARMTSDRTDRDVHPRSFENREMSFSNRISKDRNLPFNDTFSHSKRTNAIEPKDDTRGFDDASYTARMTSGRTDRYVHPRSLDNREMSFSNRISKDRNLPFNDTFSHSKRTNAIEPIDDTRGFDDASYTARMTSGRTDRYVHPRSLDNREMSFSNRISKETEAVSRTKPVSLLGWEHRLNIEANMSQEVFADERWRNEDDSMYGRNWTDDRNRGIGRSEPWRTDTKQAGRSDNEPYFRDVPDMKQDNRRSYATSNSLHSREAHGSESKRHLGRDTNTVMETCYRSFSDSHNLKSPVYGNFQGCVKQSEIDSYRKKY